MAKLGVSMGGGVIDVRGLPETEKLLASFTGNELQNRVRVATRAGAKVMRSELRDRARDPKYPRSFRRTATKGHRSPVGTSVGIRSPLINIFEPGAGVHTIAPRRGGVLTNAGFRSLEAKRAGEQRFFARGPVRHPGMDARPIIGPTFEATKDAAAEKAMDSLFTEHAPSVVLGEL